MVSQDDDVEAAVQVDLLQAIHQLAHNPVHAFQCHLQLWGTRNGTNTHELRSRLWLSHFIGLSEEVAVSVKDCCFAVESVRGGKG